jgi:hypothetical protein
VKPTLTVWAGGTTAPSEGREPEFEATGACANAVNGKRRTTAAVRRLNPIFTVSLLISELRCLGKDRDPQTTGIPLSTRLGRGGSAGRRPHKFPPISAHCLSAPNARPRDGQGGAAHAVDAGLKAKEAPEPQRSAATGIKLVAKISDPPRISNRTAAVSVVGPVGKRYAEIGHFAAPPNFFDREGQAMSGAKQLSARVVPMRRCGSVGMPNTGCHRDKPRRPSSTLAER